MPMIWAKIVLKQQFWQKQQNYVLVIIVNKMVLTCTTTCTSCFGVHHHHYHGHDQDYRCAPYFKTCTMYMLFSSSLSSIFRTFTKICGAQLILIIIIIVFQLSLPVLYAVVQSPVKLWVSSSWGSSIPRSTSKGIWSS